MLQIHNSGPADTKEASGRQQLVEFDNRPVGDKSLGFGIQEYKLILDRGVNDFFRRQQNDPLSPAASQFCRWARPQRGYRI